MIYALVISISFLYIVIAYFAYWMLIDESDEFRRHEAILWPLFLLIHCGVSIYLIFSKLASYGDRAIISRRERKLNKSKIKNTELVNYRTAPKCPNCGQPWCGDNEIDLPKRIECSEINYRHSKINRKIKEIEQRINTIAEIIDE